MNLQRCLILLAACLLLVVYAGSSSSGGKNSNGDIDGDYLEIDNESQTSSPPIEAVPAYPSEAEAERRVKATDCGLRFGASLVWTVTACIADASIRFKNPHLISGGVGLAIELVLVFLMMLDCVLFVAWLDAEFRNWRLRGIE